MRRRRLLQGLGGLVATAAFRPEHAAKTLPQERSPATEITGKLARYMVSARDHELPPSVVQAAKHRILDTLAAIVSGAGLKPGEMAIRYVQSQGGPGEASVPTTNIRTSAINAALVSGMFAHRRRDG